MSLSDTLDRLALTDGESEGLMNVLMAAVAGLTPGPHMDPETAKMLREISDALSRLRPHWESLGQNGYLWRGHFSELMPGLLERIQRDAIKQRSKAVRATRHPLLEKPALTQQVGRSKQFVDFINRLVSPQTLVEPTSSFYHYYDGINDRIEPHIDVDEFSLSCLLLVQHRYNGLSNSRFYVCVPEKGAREVALAVGDAIILYSGSVVHARSAPNPGESVTTASWGFRTLIRDAGTS